MKKLLVVLIVLSLVGVFSNTGWAQEEGEEPVQSKGPDDTETQKIERAYDQENKTQETQKIEGQYNQAVVIDRASLQMKGCKIQNIGVQKKDQVVVGSKCSAAGVPAFNRVLIDKSKDGVVDAYDDGAGIVAFSAIDSGKETKESDVAVQYSSALQLVARSLQDVAVAQGYKRFGVKEKCNQFTTEQGVKYEFFARVGLSEKNQPVILGYKVRRIETDKDAVDKDPVTIDVSMDSSYKSALAGILPVIHAGGCPLSEWIELPQAKTTPY